VARRRSAFFLLLGIVAWVAIAVAGSVLAGYLLDVVVGWLRLTKPSDLLRLLVVTCGFQIILLLGALWQARRLGNGDWRAGIGFAPVRRKGLIAMLCLAMIAWLGIVLVLATLFPGLHEYVKSNSVEVLSELDHAGPGILALNFFLIVILAPLSEELFFRGWLWEALRRRGQGIAMTMGVTAIPWLLLHGIDAPGRILILLPAAVAVSLARHLGGGIRASLTVHITNNAAATLTELVSLLFQ
jgi:uncharacterized protein